MITHEIMNLESPWAKTHAHLEKFKMVQFTESLETNG
jgi:hypothetical protein